MDKALVMLSGGLDSATCLYWARQRHKVSAITFNYFGRLEKEKQATAMLVQAAGVELAEVDVPFVKEASDFDHAQFSGPDDRWASYVPARNMIFYSIAAHYAEYLGVKWIIGGHNSHDVSFFKDATRGYIEKLNALLREGCLLCDGKAYEIALPLADLDRIGVVRLAQELGVPMELTWSCHGEGDTHCGQCYACRQRLEAFAALGIRDPAFAT
ncbi:MAG: 7-cyano-7-deazaguanine synthase [Nitrososphaera sp.]|uniref:7-cyano-7-deazaguanine synthase n=1 Tax=Nitrososphaera sp. TaxID=1971748 RepID=UPI003D6E7C69